MMVQESKKGGAVMTRAEVRDKQMQAWAIAESVNSNTVVKGKNVMVDFKPGMQAFEVSVLISDPAMAAHIARIIRRATEGVQ